MKLSGLTAEDIALRIIITGAALLFFAIAATWTAGISEIDCWIGCNS